ncbi:MAG: DUF4340 domain-containing protein [Planctomycetes bacterium]|nr:DUF4340 domain-containing protein [Planctomycetota bacterium]
MSKLNTNAKLGIALVVLVGLGVWQHFAGGRYGDTETVNASVPLFSEYKKDAVECVRIDGPDGKSVELVKAVDGWTVATESGGKADQALVDKVVGAIEKLKQGRVQSSSGDAVGYGVEGAKAIKVIAWGAGGKSGAPVAEFALGKIDGEYKNSFLKLPNEKSIRKLEAATSDFGPSTGDTWRDKSMYSHGKTDKVAQVEIHGPNGAIVLKREKTMGEKAPAIEGETPPAEAATPAAPSGELEVKETYWVMVAPKEGRAKKWLCDSLAGHVAKLDCSAFLSGGEKAADLGLDPPQYTLRAMFEGEGASKEILLVGNKGNDGKYACRLPGQEQLFWIDNWKGEYLTKSVDDLLDAPPVKLDDPVVPADGAEPAAPADGTAPAPTDSAPTDSAPSVDGSVDVSAPVEGSEPPDAEKPDDPAKPDDSVAPVDDGTAPVDPATGTGDGGDGGNR